MDSVLQNYKRLKEARRMTDYAVARDARLPLQTVYNFSQGKTVPSLVTLQKIADALGCKLSELVD